MTRQLLAWGLLGALLGALLCGFALKADVVKITASDFQHVHGPGA